MSTMPAPLWAALAFMLVGASLVVDGIRRYQREQRALASQMSQMSQMSQAFSDTNPNCRCAPLAAVAPAWTFDASDTTPDYGACPECYLLWLHRCQSAQIPRTANGEYIQPEGPAQLCPEHAASTLGRAMQREEATR